MEREKFAIIDFAGFDTEGVNEQPNKWELTSELQNAVVLTDTETEMSESIKVRAGNYRSGNPRLGEHITYKVGILAQKGRICKKRQRTYRDCDISSTAVRIKDLTEAQCELLMMLDRNADGTYRNYWFDAQKDKSEYYALKSAKDGFHSMITSKPNTTPFFWTENRWAYVYEFLI